MSTALKDYLDEGNFPVVFAGVEYLFPIFKETFDYERLVSKPLEGNHDECVAEELRDNSHVLVAEEYQRERSNAVESYRQKAHTEWAGDELNLIYKASRMGQIETLIFDPSNDVWATFKDIENPTLMSENDAETEDLVNAIVVETLRNGGRAFAVEECDSLSMTSGVGAIYRSPVESYVE